MCKHYRIIVKEVSLQTHEVEAVLHMQNWYNKK